MDQQLLTSTETAKFLKVTHATIINWRRSGSGPQYINMGPRLVRYRLSDLESWLDSQIVQSSRGAA